MTTASTNGYAATIHKAQRMTVDRAHVLATSGMDAQGSYVALSRHRDGMDLHYGRDDFADENRLVRTLSRDRAKDMASDYEQIDPAQDHPDREAARREVQRDLEFTSRKTGIEPEELLRRVSSGQSFVRHARAVDAIFAAQDQGIAATPEQLQELHEARALFDEHYLHGSRDAEAVTGGIPNSHRGRCRRQEPQ